MRAFIALIALIALAGCDSVAPSPDASDGAGESASLVGCKACPTPDAGVTDAAPPPDGPLPSSSCTGQTDPVIPLVSSPYSGHTAGANADAVPHCGDVLSPVPDVELQLELPDLLTFHAHLDPGTLIDGSLNFGRCGGGFPGYGSCDGNAAPGEAAWGMNHLRAGRYYLVVFTSPVDPGEPFTVTVNGVIQPNGRCDVPLATSGVLACAPGTTCNGTACVSPSGECGDGIDNDGDGKNGYPDDPGCQSITDPSELDTCPLGPACPPCATPADDDNDPDGYGGYPDDPGCASPGDWDEHDDCELSPWTCPLCGDLFDNDGDGLIDLDDPSCASASWNDESPEY